MVEVRNLKKEDAPKVAELIKQLTQNIVEPENLTNRLEKIVLGENFQYFVAEHEGSVVGFAGLAWYPIPSKGIISWVEEVVVDVKMRGHGIGQVLMERVMELANEKGFNQIKLTTGNPVAKVLYEKLGFVKKDEDCLVKKNY